MEGFVLVPPDRGTIIGRAVWKSRYVVLGPQPRQQSSPDSELPRTTSSTRLQTVRKGLKSAPAPKETRDKLAVSMPSSNELWLSVYKQKGDADLVSQISVRSITACEIRSVQYRKPGPTLPTLVITFVPEPSTDKSRKRRSSRTGGLSSALNAYPNSLLFRTIDEERFHIYDWKITIQPEMRLNPTTDMEGMEGPLSPLSPMFDSFINPFAASSGGASSKNSTRPELHHRGSSTTYASVNNSQTNNRPVTSTVISPSPSLRSRSSDISSSQASFFNRQPGILPIQQLPSDLPSPASTVGYDDGQSILGWTSAQGRSSALSNHTRAGSNNVSVVGTPPAPRETILDRAFQMRCIPGSDRQPNADDDRMTSIARFEALMKDAEERRKGKDGKNASKSTSRDNNTTGWELEEEDEDSDSDGEMDREADYDDELRLEEDEDLDPMSLSIHEMPTPAQRALEYISGRSTPLPQRRPNSPSPPLPTARPQPPLRSKTTLPVSRRPDRPLSLILPPNPYLGPFTNAAAEGASSQSLKRTPSNSAKRLSFNDFAKRLSSTSSLLLVQTNASSASVSSRNSHQSSEGSYVDDDAGAGAMHRGLSQSRLSGMAGVGMRSGGVAAVEAETRAHWRGSGLGVFGGEGGFL